MQLALNCAWQPLFFNAHRMDWALADILALNAALAATAWAFHRVEPLAGLLLLPYMAWVAFATYLNYAFLQLNPLVRLTPACADDDLGLCKCCSAGEHGGDRWPM